MNFIKFLVVFLLLLLPQEKLQYRDGRPTSYGIDKYVKNNQKMFIREFKQLVRDSIYNDVFFETRNFKKTTDPKLYDPQVLAYNESYGNYSSEIVVNNEEKFSGYEYKNNKNKKYYTQNDYFVKPTVFHEIMHYYFNQCMLEAKLYDTTNTTVVNRYYSQTIFIIPNVELQFGAKFIEEGLCEYLIQSNGEVPPLVQYYIPKTREDLTNRELRYDILYDYASQYVKDFCDFQILKFGKIKYPVFIILKNQPPNYEEILNPQKYFGRLLN